MLHSDILIIGAGPAGLMAAIQAKTTAPAATVRILEKGPRPGRKLIVAGSGQCNFTHAGPVDSFLGRFGGGDKAAGDPDDDGQRSPGSAGRFLRPSLYAFPPEDFITWLAERGVPAVLDESNGKYYPASRRSLDVLEVFLAELRRLAVPIELNAAVGQARRDGDAAGGFVVTDTREDFAGELLIICSGGHTYQLTGSAGDGWSLARSLGHNVTEIGPALAPVHVAKFKWVDCAGVSFKRWPIEIRRAGRVVARNRADLLITHTGLSGPAVIDASRWIRPGDEIVVPLGDFGTAQDAESALLELSGRHPKRLVRSLLAELCAADRLADHLCVQLALPADLRASSLDKESRRKLSLALAGSVFPVGSLGGLDEAMASRGGVRLDEIDPKTMASRQLPGLYFAGEVLDVDGDSGGFNIQAAWSTGALAGRSAALAWLSSPENPVPAD
ncbi:MAG: hypothetical protein A2087_06845 [Spirochaetes bacterium GWD1_61_31]|nr:MAG: hypothetical protein A2Y37_08625 [Spirochaetes bacterium GWB1_60_80]OHD40066.1 MAG: hypothetical protein A2087_06845 [Spirochaetes bacterium GWD1_61_31]OHD45885.1 MAG: hypothetical protein A2Y35_04260 [Spirochaetes bacterium GWE1_60_18]OHD58429.1 MAG: hypothetical protein A2Y32_06650 [Spirochaetes bacterium GWF1_60_12]HAX37646.1 NAD(P)/FAD-dependent oxidoreductase [Spirochaetaceae bacterium]